MLAERFPAMGTEVLVVTHAERAAQARSVVERLFAEWEGVLSRFRPESDLSRLNARAGMEVEVDGILVEVTAASLAAARATGGLFDPTLEHELTRIGYDRTFELIGAVRPATCPPRGGGGWRRVRVDGRRGTVTLPAGCHLDLGGIAKGIFAWASVTGRPSSPACPSGCGTRVSPPSAVRSTLRAA
jgi:thiamine biosynthesis lipoprotein